VLFGQATVRQPFYAMITSFIARREAPAATASAADSSDRDVFCDYLTDWIKLPRTTPRQHVCHVLSTSTDRCNVRISCHEQYLTPWKIKQVYSFVEIKPEASFFISPSRKIYINRIFVAL